MVTIQNSTKQRQRILIMDSDRDMLTLLSRTLELEGFDVVAAADCGEALNCFWEIKPHLIIMDAYASECDCVLAMDTIREQSDIPIIVITVNTQMESLKEVFAHGADDFIRKPFAVRPFIAKIKAKLRRYYGQGQPTVN